MKQPLASITSSAMVVIVALLTMSMRLTLTAADTMAELDAKLLHDIMHKYTEYIPTNTNKCPDSSDTTTFTDEWPGANQNVYWDPTTVQNYEEALFQTRMTHTDTTGDGRGWEVRFGTGGNIYSLYAPNLYGEAMPPQAHPKAPFIDEVHQSVSVNGALNDPQGIKYYLHQAGAYQGDSPYTDNKPFFSPSLAKHCEANYCMFASWGTSAHVATRFTSPIIYINKYTNCGKGIIQHDLMIHNFADPTDPQSTANNVDQTYFNVVWTGARTSNLPHALEADRTTGILNYQDPDVNDVLNLKSWGNDGPTSVANGCDAITSERVNIDQLRGYTAFAGNGLLVKEPELKRSCRKPNANCADDFVAATGCNNGAQDGCCMVDECRCDNGDAAWDTYTEMDLFVRANASPNCKYHSANHQNPADGRYYINVQCDMHDTGFGKDTTYRSDPDMQLCRSDTGACFNTPYIRSWSWSPTTRRAYFATEFYADESNANKTIAETTTTSFFNNVGSSTQLNIEFRQKVSNEVITPPSDYDPGSVPAFTYVYGTGEDYVSNVDGFARRRAGTSSRDFTVFTVNWWSGSRLKPGETYWNRQFLISSNLTHVQDMANDLVPEVEIREWSENYYDPRKLDLYWQASSFSAVAASTVQGTTTSCPSSAQLATDCQGYSTPKGGHVAYFYITCGAQTHAGPDPYYFTPGSYSNFTFPAHASTADSVRAYLCEGQDPSIRPTWKLLGFFPKTCTSLASATYDDTICQPTSEPSISSVPSGAPTETASFQPSQDPSFQPSQEPSLYPTKSPTKTPSKSPVTEVPTSNPSKSPSDSPVTDVPTSNPSTSPVTEVPTSNPTKGPSDSPVTDVPTSNPSTSPVTEVPTSNPSKGPSDSPVTANPTSTPISLPGVCSDSSGSCSETDLSRCNCALPFRRHLQGDCGTFTKKSQCPSYCVWDRKNGGCTDLPQTPNPITANPTPLPVSPPSLSPTKNPTMSPTEQPTLSPSVSPTKAPTLSLSPSVSPATDGPTQMVCECILPTPEPTKSPTDAPVTPSPVTTSPSKSPTDAPVTPAPVTPAPVTLVPVVTNSCDDGVCGVGESCDGRIGTVECTADCDGRTSGKPSNRYCFVEGSCEGGGCP